jgi:hypothetical protein
MPAAAPLLAASVKNSSTGNASGRTFQTSWKSKYAWLYYHTSENKVFCHVCQKCDELNVFTFTHQRDDAITRIGYDNWKHALDKFSNHETSKLQSTIVCKSLLLGHQHAATENFHDQSSAVAEPEGGRGASCPPGALARRDGAPRTRRTAPPPPRVVVLEK